MISRARSSGVPTTMRSGCLKSRIAAPSAQELRARHHGDIDIGPRLDALDLVAGADRHRRFRDDHGEPGECRSDLAGDAIDVGEVGMAVTATAMNTASASRPARTFAWTSSPRPGSKIGILPATSAAILTQACPYPASSRALQRSRPPASSVDVWMVPVTPTACPYPASSRALQKVERLPRQASTFVRVALGDGRVQGVVSG